MKQLLLATTLLYSSNLIAQEPLIRFSTNASQQSITTRACSTNMPFSSCLESRVHNNGVVNTLTLNKKIARTNLGSSFTQTQHGLRSNYFVRNQYASLRTNALNGELQTTTLQTSIRNWDVNVHYLHEQEGLRANITKGPLRILLEDANTQEVGLSYQFARNNWLIRTNINKRFFPQTNYSIGVRLEGRF